MLPPSHLADWPWSIQTILSFLERHKIALIGRPGGLSMKLPESMQSDREGSDRERRQAVEQIIGLVMPHLIERRAELESHLADKIGDENTLRTYPARPLNETAGSASPKRRERNEIAHGLRERAARTGQKVFVLYPGGWMEELLPRQTLPDAAHYITIHSEGEQWVKLPLLLSPSECAEAEKKYREIERRRTMPKRSGR